MGILPIPAVYVPDETLMAVPMQTHVPGGAFLVECLLLSLGARAHRSRGMSLVPAAAGFHEQTGMVMMPMIPSRMELAHGYLGLTARTSRALLW